jgi:hypothetical protein
MKFLELESKDTSFLIEQRVLGGVGKKEDALIECLACGLASGTRPPNSTGPNRLKSQFEDNIYYDKLEDDLHEVLHFNLDKIL